MFTRQDLLNRLNALKLPYELVSHPPMVTVQDGEKIRRRLTGRLGKCLFLTNRTCAFWLVAVPADMRVDLKRLAQELSTHRLSFAPRDDLYTRLGVVPGSVSVLALINDIDRRVGLVFEESLLSGDEPVNFHPLENDASVALKPKDLMAFFAHTGHNPKIVRGIGALAPAP